MFGSTIIDVAIGMIFVYSLLSMIASKINDMISGWLQWRAKDLENGVRTLLSDSNLHSKVWNHPLVQGLAGKEGKAITHLPANTFALALFDAIMPSGEGPTALEKVRTQAMKMSESSMRQAVVAIIDSANGNIEQARTGVESWFNSAMDQVSAVYKQQMQWLSLLVALLVTVIFGTDTLEIANRLWQEPVLRAAVAGAAQTTQVTQIQEAVNALSHFTLPIGWTTLPTTTVGWIQKVMGMLITTLAVSLGAPFWYDLLKNLTAARTPSAPPK